MEALSNTFSKQTVVEATDNLQALQVMSGAPLAPASRETALVSSRPTAPPIEPPRDSTSSDTTSGGLSLGLLGTI
ncbi:UNVERIFIED_CONTAM: hypothetical protein Sradi_1879200 [Sesamum radiatum]|uniref:Uncharacterized protein n=1 Tax=Sesamum radiatum TaxID=300843 RepID=A0AAW2TY67_SESRA